MLLENGLGALNAQNHERGGVGVGCGAVLGEHGGREQGVLHGVARLGVDGVGILLTVLVIELAVVAAGGHCDVGDVKHRLELAID